MSFVLSARLEFNGSLGVPAPALLSVELSTAPQNSDLFLCRSSMLEIPEILAHPSLRAIMKQQASAFLQVQREMPRRAAIFAPLQRYLLAQLAMAMIFESGGAGVVLRHYLDAVTEHGVASRNTAHAFIREMIRYEVAAYNEKQSKGRRRPVIVTEATIVAIRWWLTIHLASLDAFDGGGRVARLQSEPDLLARIHPLAARRLLVSAPQWTQPGSTFSLFTWTNDGGLIMDKMITAIEDRPLEAERVSTSITDLEELAEPLRITRTHLLRRMAAAEADGSLGWEGKRGASRLWLSKDFVAHYDKYQADKLACIDAAFHAVAPASNGERITY